MSLRAKMAAKVPPTAKKKISTEETEHVEMSVRCLAFRPMAKGSMVGFCDLELGHGSMRFILRDCVAHEKGDDAWVNLPSKQYRKADGTNGYSPLFEAHPRQAFQTAALAAIEAFNPEAAE